MDPNECLKSIRMACAEYNYGSSVISIPRQLELLDILSENILNVERQLELLEILSENILNLDQWLTSGGFLPDEWKNKFSGESFLIF